MTDKKGANSALPGFNSLAAHFDYEISFEWGPITTRVKFHKLLSDIASRRHNWQTRRTLKYLCHSDRGFLIILILRLIERHLIRPSRSVLASLHVLAAQAYVKLNAFSSAYSTAQTVTADHALWRELRGTQKREVKKLLARCALQSGRGEEAIGRYRELMIETSEEVDTVVDYINAVYPSNFEESKRHCLNVLHRWRPVPSKELSFVGDLLAHDGHATQAQLAFDRVLRRDPFYAEAYLGIANLALTMKKRHEWKRWLARYFEYHGTPGIEFDANTAIAPFSIVCPTVPPISDSPKVTIVMTTYNSSALLNHSVLSVLRQSIRNLEIFIVDDCSTDETPKLIQELAKTDRRIKPIYNDKNIGTYASKNKAIVLSSGTFVTFHDSDDWMHPRRIERYLTAMTDDTFCCTSQWIRMDQVGRVVVRRTNPYTHLNPASTFFRRTAFDQIGLFDEVRVGADAEFITRAYHFSGKRAFTDLGACLGIGLHHENSLTRSGEASFDQFRYSPIRLEYTENWVERQLEQFGRSPVPKIPS